ncbi:MAG TPA: sigma-70 family RNA polymerase sigma factor [Gaiellaceae bacterium]|jgi:RNA polymerase sigma factor (sigma-70 family)
MAAAGNAGRNVADATHELYRQYGKQIYAYCLHQLRSREEAEDAVQTTFLNAFRGLQRGTTTRFEQAWLYKIAQNVCIARRSSSGRRLRVEAPDDFEILQEVVPSGNAAAEGDTLELMGLDDALDSMPENQRRAILLREWQGLSYREIASELGLTQGAVEMLIFRARRTLATALEQPDVAEKRTKSGKAKTGFSFGSLIAAMKSLMAGGAAVKMAAVAVSAAVVGTNTVHSVAHRAFVWRTHTGVGALAAPVTAATTRHVPTQLVTFRAAKATSRTDTVTAGAAHAQSTWVVATGHTPTLPQEAVPAPGTSTDTAPGPAVTSTPETPAQPPAPVQQSASASSPPAEPLPPSGSGGHPSPPVKVPVAPVVPTPPGSSKGSDDPHHGQAKDHGSSGGKGKKGDTPAPGTGPLAEPYTTMTVAAAVQTTPTDTTSTVTDTTTTTETATTTTTTTTTPTTTTTTTETITTTSGDGGASPSGDTHGPGGGGDPHHGAGGDGGNAGGHGHHGH